MPFYIPREVKKRRLAERHEDEYGINAVNNVYVKYGALTYLNGHDFDNGKTVKR